MVWETFRSGAKVPGPLKAQRWVFSGWTLTKYQGTVHSPYTHVYSIIAQVPIPRCAAHVSWKGLFFLTVKPQTLPTACKALFLCLPPRPPLCSLCPRHTNLFLFLKLFKFFALCLVSIFPTFGLGSLQVSPCPRGLPTSQHRSPPPSRLCVSL